MKNISIIASIIVIAFLQGCEETIPDTSEIQISHLKSSGNWTIPINEVFDGGAGKDGIPALSDPEFIPVNEVDYLRDDDLVLGFMGENQVRAYPHAILNWHEIVNDQIEDVYLSVTYCPLTGTGIGWDRVIDGEVSSFGVSGLIYNTNLIPYDRMTDSNWSQIMGECVNGELVGRSIKTHHLVETTWLTWKNMFPSSSVMSTETGYNRDYKVYPYGGYMLIDDFLLFPVSHTDDRIPNKERVHGIVFLGLARVYTFSEFEDGVIAKQETIRGRKFVIAGSSEDNFIVSYYSDPGDGTELEFKGVQNKYPIVMTDQECNMWDLFGKAVSGPRKGTQLKPSGGFMGYWLAFAAFYPGVEISNPSSLE